jgi:UDP-N-acetylmuramyl pentapeptide phosphotransferase/UDP-N-acetylglucosamine-1-phosphate transferase
VVQKDRTLEIRAGLLVLGATIGVLGMATETDWLIYTAIGVVAIGGVLAILRRIKRD